MKNKYSNNFKKALKAFEKAGELRLVDYCKHSPDLGKTPRERELNSWKYILDLYVEELRSAELREEAEQIFNEGMSIFFFIPDCYRKKVFNHLHNKYGIDIIDEPVC